MRHSMFDLILDLKNVQKINKRKVQDYHTTKGKSQAPSNSFLAFELYLNQFI